MVIDVRTVFIIGVFVYLFTRYYIEKEYGGEEIFWLYSVLSAVLGLMAALTVINAHPSKAYFIPFTSIAIVMAILYYPGDSEPKTMSG
jgi:uncharacterized membrane protein